MFPKVYTPKVTSVLFSLVVGTPDETENCTDVREELNARAIIHIVIGVGSAGLDWTYVTKQL